MKRLLSCDDVFEALTRGEPCLHQDDAALAEHLCACDECHHLAEMIRPSAEFLSEEADWSSEGDAGALATQVLARLDTEQRNSPQVVASRFSLSISAHTWMQLAAAASILVALGTFLWATAPLESAGRHEQALLGPFSTSLAAARQPDEHGLLHLASLNLPKVCLTAAPASPSPEIAAALQCCTRCHHAGDSISSVRLVAFSQASCLACHKG